MYLMVELINTRSKKERVIEQLILSVLLQPVDVPL
jgi:hypothetical protein